MDNLVSVIFEAVKKEKATPEERRLALVRAGSIARIYEGDNLLTNQIFESVGNLDELKQHDNLDLSGSGTAVNGGTH